MQTYIEEEEMKHVLRKGAFAFPLLALAVVAPVTYDFKEDVLTVNTACAQDDCCKEVGSICGLLDDYKPNNYASDGPCPTG